MRKFICTALAALLLSTNAYAEIKLPDGSVQGLPQNIIIMDDEGYSPKEDGELYIYIPNMLPGEKYTKEVTVMNARDDAIYDIFMKATPNYNGGEVDLLNETECKLYLDDELIYQGLVNGDGTPNMQNEGINLGGTYGSGETRKLRAEFVWNITDETQKFVDEYNDSEQYYHGIVSFHWTFYAQVGSETTTRKSSGGGGGSGSHIHHDTTTETISSSTTPDGKLEIVVPNNPINPDNPSDSDSSDSSDGTSDDTRNISDSVSSDLSDTINDSDNTSTVDRIIGDVVDNVPFIPEDVKTGYHSELVMYTKIAVVAFLAAVVLAVAIGRKMYKLRKLKKR